MNECLSDDKSLVYFEIWFNKYFHLAAHVYSKNAGFFFFTSLTYDVIRASIFESQIRLDQSKQKAYIVHCIIADILQLKKRGTLDKITVNQQQQQAPPSQGQLRSKVAIALAKAEARRQKRLARQAEVFKRANYTSAFLFLFISS